MWIKYMFLFNPSLKFLLTTLFWGIYVRAASSFCWQPSFGVYLSLLRHVFADGPVLGYICPCPATFLLTSQFWGIFVRAALRFCWRPSFGVYLSVPRHIFADGPVLGYICPCCVMFLLTACFWGISVRAASRFSDSDTFLLTACFWGISVRAASRFSDSPVLWYICPCCITFLLTEPFWDHRCRIIGPMWHRFYFIKLQW